MAFHTPKNGHSDPHTQTSNGCIAITGASSLEGSAANVVIRLPNSATNRPACMTVNGRSVVTKAVKCFGGARL